MRYCWLFLLLILLVGCSNEKVEKEFYKNGQLKEAVPYKGRQIHGEYEAYYENGQIRAKGFYEGGKMVGVWKYWYKNGSPMSEGTYKENQLIDLQAWDKKGDQTIKDCTGTAILYYPDGSRMSQVSYKNCLMHGEWITWFKNGQVESEFYYDEGVPTGIWKFWNPDGTLQKAEKHDGGMEH
jgi:antitoxin component YwqK of YwqJK toxin-antitoxin module